MTLIPEKRFTITVTILIHGKDSLQQTNLYRGKRDSFEVIKLTREKIQKNTTILRFP